MSIYRTYYRNSINGYMCTQEYAEMNPDTTTKEIRLSMSKIIKLVQENSKDGETIKINTLTKILKNEIT